MDNSGLWPHLRSQELHCYDTRIDAIGADDLPDIVDVVMEMGRPDEGPSPPPPVLDPRQTSLPTHLEKLADRARDYVEAAGSANTRRACASDYQRRRDRFRVDLTRASGV